LDPEVGAVLKRALEAADAALYGPDKWTTVTPVTQRRADALGLIAECALRGGLGADGADATDGPAGADDSRPAARPPAPGHRADRYQVVVHVDTETLVAGSESGQSVLEDGARSVRVPAETSRRLACDVSLVVMTHDTDWQVLDVGCRTRTVPPALRRALKHRDGGCRFPGCGLRYCDAHHVKHWADGGETKLDNVVLLCRTHHRAVHEEGLRVEMMEAGSGGAGRIGPAVRFYRPNGRALPEVPDPPRLLPDPLAALEAENLRHGVQVDPDTTTPGWLGEGLNLGYAIDVLRL